MIRPFASCRLPAAALLACAALASAARAQYPLQTLATLAGDSPTLEFMTVDAERRATFRPLPDAAGKQQPDVVVPLDELVAWGYPAEFARGPFVLLVDGSVVAAQSVTSNADVLDLSSPLFGGRGIPLAQVRGVVFQSPGSPAKRDRLFQATASPAPGDRDRLLLVGRDELVGTVSTVDGAAIDVQTEFGPTRVELTRVAALVFNPALAAVAPASGLRVVVGLRDGTQIISAPPVSEGDTLHLRPWALLDRADAPLWSVPRSHVVFLQTIAGGARYLSDLEPLGYRHVPYLSRAWDYEADRSTSGGNLRAGGKRYAKGLGMHSASRITYAIDDAAKRFEASAAIDDETAGRGSVTFRVFVDGEERFRSDIVRGGDAPTPVSVDLAGGKQLSLVVDFADFADEQDHADWLNARFVP